MGKVKIKAKMKGGKPSKGTLLASVPVSAKASPGRDGKMLFNTTVIIALDPKTDQHGNPRK